MRIQSSRIIAGLATTAAVLAIATVAQAQTKTRVAVRSFAAKGVDASTAGTVETSFCNALSNQGFDVVCPDDVKALISVKQADLGLGNCDSDEECIKNIAKVADAGRVVTGEVSKLGDQYIISATMIDAVSGHVLGRASETTKKIDDILDRLDSLAKKLASAK